MAIHGLEKQKIPAPILDRWRGSRFFEFTSHYKDLNLKVKKFTQAISVPSSFPKKEIEEDLLWQFLTPKFDFFNVIDPIKKSIKIATGANDYRFIPIYINPKSDKNIVIKANDNACVFALIYLLLDNKDQANKINIFLEGNEKSVLLTDLIVITKGTLNINILMIGGWWQRTWTRATFLNENAQVNIKALMVIRDNEHHDFHTDLIHEIPNTKSDQLVKSIVWEGGSGIFSGKIIVKKGAKYTNAYQLNRNLIVSENKCSFASRPFLEINEDEVRCTHGSATSSFNSDELFYLMIRGIPEKTAKKILIRSFAQEVIGFLPERKIKSILEAGTNL